MIRYIAALLLALTPQFAVPLHPYSGAPVTSACSTTSNGSVTSMVINLNVAPGGVTILSYANASANGGTVSSLTDTLGNSWAFNGSTQWSCHACIGGADTITLGFSPASGLQGAFGGITYATTTGVVDGAGNWTHCSPACNAPVTTGNVTTANANDRLTLVAYGNNGGTPNTPAGYTLDGSCSGTGNVMYFFSKVLSSTGTYNASVSWTGGFPVQQVLMLYPYKN